MAGAKEIRNQIASLKKTRQITSAMEMVAASKKRKTQERMAASKPYANKIYEMIKHLARATSEYRHPFLEKRDINRIGLIVVTTDRGLCGGLNTILLRDTIKNIRAWQEAGKEVSLCVIGRKGQAFFKRFGGKVLASIDNLGDSPSIQNITGIVKVMWDAFSEGQIDSLYIVHNEFVNTMIQKPVTKQLLPLPVAEDDAKSLGHHWDYIYEPDPKTLLDTLLKLYVESLAYQALVENIASEQAAKMLAMKNATENTTKEIENRQSAYNKARQAAITQELAEIVGGAAAL